MNKSSRNVNGAGRKPNAGTRLQRYEVAELVKSKKSPLDIMLRRMHKWDEAADNFEQRINDLMKAVAEDGADDETIKRLQGAFKGWQYADDKVLGWATAAAPFIHSKLQSIMLKAADDRKRVVTLTLPPTHAERMNEDRSYRIGYGDPVPIKKKA